ncbi:hypothetical protein Pan216_33160 [Planctomycetes bacterium Pan216]|uniref:Secreted protein n=1 Tax=Kolteria novifilia TaxID=2527975 RepID=A0A518B643_9BACT|nr:hypothetical protein Pan216_33160 [Planctomycetes bacterium Pan216]
MNTLIQHSRGVVALLALVACPWALHAKEATTRFVLLTNDRVMEGDVFREGDGVAVHKSGGTIVFPRDQVALVADTMVELYEFKKTRIPLNDSEAHFRLAMWCGKNKLTDQKESELRHVLSLDPAHEDAALWLRRMTKKTRRSVRPDHQIRPRRRHVVMADPAAVIESFQLAHGNEAFENYVQLEKFLVNRCADAGCHGSSLYRGEFRLYRRPLGRHGLEQRLTARNLEAVKQAIDFERPEQSPILYFALEAHGGRRVPPMAGVNDPNYRELRDWVAHVVTTHDYDTSLPIAAPSEQEASEPLVRSGSQSMPIPRQRFIGRPTRPGGTRVITSKPRGDGFAVDRQPVVPSAPEPDPFDPALFNRQMVGRPSEPKAKEGTANSTEPAPSKAVTSQNAN